MRHLSLTVFFSLAACAGPNDGALTSLEAEVRRLRSEQERMASQIDQIQNRLTLTEDTARAAHNAVDVANRRQVISLGTDTLPTEPIRVDASRSAVTQDEGASPSSARTSIRVTRGDRPPEPSGFTALPPSERLPVTPVPPLPQGAPRLPITVPPPPPGAPRGPGATYEPVPGALDPNAVPAYNDALRLARGGRCSEAIEGFARFLARWPEHPHADNAAYWRAECVLQGGDARRAAQEFEGLVARYPTGNKVPDALYKLSVIYRRLGDATASMRVTQRLETEFPDSDAARLVRSEREGS
jgi:tol-pal system protein YbgF